MTQTRRHSFIVSLLGLRHVVVAINKMDLVGYSQRVFEQIKEEYTGFVAKLDLRDIIFGIPMSALKGEQRRIPKATRCHGIPARSFWTIWRRCTSPATVT